MTKFADQLYADLIREHGSTLTDSRRPAASRRQFASRRVLLASGAGGIALAATAGALVASAGAPASVGHPAAASGAPAYKLTAGHDGTITLAVYQTSGIAQANAKLHQLGDNVVVVPVEAGCPTIGSLPAPTVSARGIPISVESGRSKDGSITVNAQGIPAGDIMVIGFVTSAQGTAGTAAITSPPAPACISLPAGSGNAVQSGTNGHHTGAGSGTNVAVNAR
jgi:hypothetical protein